MSTPSPAVSPFPIQLKLDDTLGVAYICNVIAAVFYGLTTVQTYIYLPRSRKDPRSFRILIIFLWLLDTTHLILISQVIYHYAITNFANPLALLEIPVTLGVHIVIAGSSDVVVRGIYMYRIWLFSNKNIPLISIIAFVSFLAFLGSPALAAAAIKAKLIAKFPDFAWLVYCTFSTGALADVLIATSLCVLLWRRRTGFQRTDSTINTLMLYTINTGALTSCVSIVSIITFAAMPTKLVYLGLLFILPKLLLNSLLANLNARPTLKSSTPSELISVHLSNMDSSTASRHHQGRGHSHEEPVSAGFAKETADGDQKMNGIPVVRL